MAPPVIWALPAEVAAADDELVRAFDASIRDGETRAAGHLACRIGCTHCCLGPFEITALDAGRLVRGVRELARTDAEAAAAVVGRARDEWPRLAGEYPGDPVSGRLADDDRSRAAFFARFAGTPCPALDPATGACLVYPWRPLSCRTYGLPVRHGRQLLEPCPLNFTCAPAEVVAAATVEPDPSDREGRLLADAEAGGVRGDTIVCAALAGGG